MGRAVKAGNGQAVAEPAAKPQCVAYAKRGIRTARDFSNMMAALMGDLVEGRIAPNIGNATCNAGGKLLKAVEMQHKYGKGAGRTLQLAAH